MCHGSGGRVLMHCGSGHFLVLGGSLGGGNSRLNLYKH